ncbi:M28 family metallopeptidase [Aliikangiella maris]|uniref:M28 family metallopeptidase n=2 Tax=Aliikangiella maris TaxID=3162458 RepID=A0ABV3MV79_9GAMM
MNIRKLIPIAALTGAVLSCQLQAHSNSLTSQDANLQNDNNVWISIGSDAYSLINQKHTASIAFSQSKIHNASHGNIAIVQVPESQISTLSEIMHDEFNRCGGFVFHESLEEAQSYALRPVQMAPSVMVSYSIDNATSVNQLLNQLSTSGLSSTVNSLSNYHNRYYTQQTGVDAANWIKSKWQEISSSRSDISVETFSHSWNQPSVIATITGTTNPDEIVVIGGHLDSINSSNPSGGRAPGADDNASGIAVVTETLKAIVASGFKPKRTIQLMGYAAEEVGLRGSKAIAQSYQNKNVVGVAQFDMTGRKGPSSNDIVFMTDYTNSAQTQFMQQLIDTYLPGVTYGNDRCGYACSDHASWHNAGFPASMPFESNFNDSNRSIHTSNDTAFDSSHAIKFAKLSVAFAAELAKGSTGTNPDPDPDPKPDNVLENGVAKNNLSANRGEELAFTFDVPEGAGAIEFKMSGGSGDADLYVKFGSKPTSSSYDCRPYKSGNNETCTGSQANGTYHVVIKAYSSFSGVSIVANYVIDDNPVPGPDPIDESINNISLNRGQWSHYTQQLEEGYESLTVTISGGTGDIDLYTNFGSQSTSSNWDCRPYKNGNNEVCTFNNPQAGTWYIDLYGYSSSSGATLNVKAIPLAK